MKQKDILIIIIVSVIAGVFSFIVANALFGGEKAYKLTAPTVDAISAQFTTPDEAYFNKDSINPTKDITIGDSANTQPFNTPSN